MDKITEEEIDFIRESNAIEEEYSEEALEDAIEAWEYAKVMNPLGRKIDVEYIRTIHNILMRRLNSKIGGKIRVIPIYVGTRKNYRECLKPDKIDEELRKWCKRGNIRFLQSPKDEGIETIEKIHVEFENIHPFEDGNGRVGRILMNIQRIRSGMNILIIHEGKEQQEYYKWFKDSQSSGSGKDE